MATEVDVVVMDFMLAASSRSASWGGGEEGSRIVTPFLTFFLPSSSSLLAFSPLRTLKGERSYRPSCVERRGMYCRLEFILPMCVNIFSREETARGL